LLARLHVELQENGQSWDLAAEVIQPLRQFEAIQRVHQVKVPGHKRRFATLNVADHVPFYSRIFRHRLNFRDTFLGVILAEDPHPGFDCSLHDLQRLRLRDNHQLYRIRQPPRFFCCGGDTIQRL
jgi:hypothetical protein